MVWQTSQHLVAFDRDWPLHLSWCLSKVSTVLTCMPAHLQALVSLTASLLGGQAKQANWGEKEVIKAQILEESQIVCSTLSFAGSSVLAATGSKFDCVIIDEAAQAVEPSTLIPLVSGCKQVHPPALIQPAALVLMAVEMLREHRSTRASSGQPHSLTCICMLAGRTGCDAAVEVHGHES